MMVGEIEHAFFFSQSWQSN